MIVGATPENDYQMMAVTQALYENYGLKRVFYSAYVPVNDDSCLPSVTARPPLLREHRLYQADWLLRFYGFKAEELLSEEQPNFNVFLDPKCDWALRHLELFPVEINRASYGELLRVPGMGVKSVQRIVNARKQGGLRFEDVKKMGVVLKRARYFITCNGRMMEGAGWTRIILHPVLWEMRGAKPGILRTGTVSASSHSLMTCIWRCR